MKMAEALRKKLEKLVNKIDQAEDNADNSIAKTNSLQEDICENETLSEDLKRRISCAKKQLTSTLSRVDETRAKLESHEVNLARNEAANEKLSQEADLKEDLYNEIETKSAKSKLDHMELSGAYEDARSRKQLLSNEIEKMKTMRRKHELHSGELLNRIEASNKQLESLSHRSERNLSFEEHAETATANIDSHIQRNQSLEDEAKQGIDVLKNEIKSKLAEIEVTRHERQKLEAEIQQIVDDIDTV